MLVQRYGPLFGIWVAVACALLFLLPQMPFAWLGFYLLSLLLIGWKMAHAQRWLEILREGPHPLSPAAADWQPASENEKQAAAQTRTGWEALLVAVLLVGIPLFLLGQLSLIQEGWQALTNQEITLKARAFMPESPLLAWSFLVLGLVGFGGILVADLLVHLRENTPGRVGALRWRNRLSWGAPLVFLVGIGFWTGWLTRVESLAWVLSVLIFGGLFLLIVRWTW